MKKELGQLVKHSGIYGLGTILNKSVGFFLIPLYTHYLKPADYGVLEILDLIIFFCGNFAMLGIGSAFFRFFAAADSEDEKKIVTATAIVSVGIISVFVLALMQLFAGQLSRVTFGSESYVSLVRVVAFTLLFANLSEVPLAYLRAKQQTVIYVLVSLARTIVSASMLIMAVAVLQKGVLGVVYANSIANGLAGLTLTLFILLRTRRKPSFRQFVEMCRYGTPLILEGLAMFVLAFSDRFFLRRYASLSEVGVYSLGYKLASIVAVLVGGPLRMTWTWQQFELAKNENAKHLYAKMQTYQLVVSVLVGLGIAVMAKDILRVMTPSSYWGAHDIVPIIALVYVVDIMRSVVVSGIYVKRTTLHLGAISPFAAGFNLVLNVLLIPRYHAMGAAIATLLSYVFFLILSYVIAQRVYSIPYEYVRNAAILLAATAIYFSSTLFHLPLVGSVVVNGSLFLLFLAASAVILGREEREMFLQLGLKAARRLRDSIPLGQA